MPFDSKYGELEFERQRNIGDDEQVVVFRAADIHLPALLDHYLLLCASGGSPQNHLRLIEKTKQEILDWQKEHGSHIPESKGVDPNG